MCKGIFCIDGKISAITQLTSALATSFVLVAGAPAETLLVSADTHTRSNFPKANFGTTSDIRVRSGFHTGYLLFDLDSLDSGDVLGATLRIHVRAVTQPAQIAVHEVLGSWDEETLTHQTAPPLNLIPTAESPVAPGDAGSYRAIDVTALVAAWIANPSSNFGLSLQSLTSDARVRFSSREAGLPATLEVELMEKPNVARVQVKGGDYSNPIDAMNDSDSWCDVSSLSRTDSCQLLIGPGTFHVSETLNLRDKFDVIGAGSSGSQRTELVAQLGVETVILMPDVGSAQGNVISDIVVRNNGGANGNVKGILASLATEDDPATTIRNTLVQVNGGVADRVTGIQVGSALLRDVDVFVGGGSNALGISTNCVDAADVRVDVRAFDAQSSAGWRETSDCGTPVIRFDVLVRGQNSIGMRFDTMHAAQLSEGVVVVDSINGTGIAIAGATHLQNVRVSASTAIQCLFCEVAVLDNIHTPDSQVALNLSRIESVHVTDSTFLGQILVPSDPLTSPSDRGRVRIDNSAIGAITIEPGPSVFIGSSKVMGPITSGPGQLTCINVYDGNYQPITCN